MAVKTLLATGAIALNGVASTDYSGGPVVVGTGPILGDNDTATYVKPDFRPGGWTVGLPALTNFGPDEPVVLQLTLQVLLQTGDRAEGHIFIATDPEGTNRVGEFADGSLAGGGFLIQDGAGSTYWPSSDPFVVTLDPAADNAAVLAALAGGAYLVFDAFTGTPDVSFPTRNVRVYEATLLVGEPDPPLPEPDPVIPFRTEPLLATPYVRLEEGRYLATLPSGQWCVWTIDEEGNQSIGPAFSPSSPGYFNGPVVVSPNLFINGISPGGGGSDSSRTAQSYSVAEDGTISLVDISVPDGQIVNEPTPPYWSNSSKYYYDGKIYAHLIRSPFTTSDGVRIFSLDVAPDGTFADAWVEVPGSPYTPAQGNAVSGEGFHPALTPDGNIVVWKTGAGQTDSAALDVRDPFTLLDYRKPSLGTDSSIGKGSGVYLDQRQNMWRDTADEGVLLKRLWTGDLTSGRWWIERWGWDGSAMTVLQDWKQPERLLDMWNNGYLVAASEARADGEKVVCTFDVRTEQNAYNGVHVSTVLAYDVFGEPIYSSVPSRDEYESYTSVVDPMPGGGEGYFFGVQSGYLTEDDYWSDISYRNLVIWGEKPPPPPALVAHHGKRIAKFTVGPRPEPVTQPVTINERVSPGDVVVLAGAPTIVGAANQWGDGDDATYVELHDGAAKAPIPSTESAGPLVVNIRYSGTSSAGDPTGRLAFDIRQADNTEILFLALENVVLDGGIHELSYTVTEADYTGNSTTAEAVADALATGTTSMALSSFQGSDLGYPEITVYETSIGVTYQVEITITPDPDPAALTPRGPDDDVHHGYFRIDRVNRSISAQAQVASLDPMWIQPWAQYLIWDDETEAFVMGPSHPVGAPLRTAQNGWQQANIFEEVGDDQVTHWALRLVATENDPRTGDLTPPEPGQEFYADCIFAPDNGLPVAEEPYLDGDQPGAMWEGPKHDSTSVYGTPPPTNLSEIINLDDDLLILEQGVPDAP